MKVQGFVDGQPCQMTIDTGAEGTFVRPEWVAARHLPEAKQQLCGVTGHCTSLKGPVEVRIGVGSSELLLPVYVADVEDSCLLGLDYLTRVGACVDLGRKLLRVGREELPLLPGDAPAEVLAMRRVRLAPRSETRVPCMLSRKMVESAGMVEVPSHSKLADGVTVARSMVKSGEKFVTVLVANFSDEHRTIPAGAQVGTCEEIAMEERPSKSESFPVGSGFPKHLVGLAERSASHLTQQQRMKMEDTLQEFADVFSKGDADLGRTGLVKHRIDTGDARPIKHVPRRIPPARREEMQQAVKDMERQGLVERSDSPWSSAVVLVSKKDGTKRFCVDYRALNDRTVKDSYPLPRIDDTLDALAGACWFSTLDLKSGYHQVEMAEEDKAKTAFSFGQGLWQFTVMPFGLCNAPSCFERLMERVLEGLHWKTALLYIDDVIVFGSTFEEELERLREVFQRLRAANLKLSPKKCLLFQPEVPFLGHVVGRDGVRTDPQKISAVQKWPVPKSVAEVRSFLGLCTYYRRFVQGFAQVAAPLHSLTRKGVHFQWNERHQDAFENLKKALAEAPVLPYPNPTTPYLLDTDASDEGVGAVLAQVKDGKEHVVAYYSAKFDKAERNYCTTRKELLAVIKSLEHFHPYLYGAKFTVRTDHAALRWMKTLKAPEGQLARWLGRLEQYDYEMQHRPGRIHNNADSLSRRPCESSCKHCSKREEKLQCKRLQVTDELQDTEEEWRQAQRADADLAPLIRWMTESTTRPAWQQVSPESSVTKCLWRDWEMLRLTNGVLQRRWVSTRSRPDYWVVLVPRARRRDLVEEIHGGMTSGHLGEKKTLSRLRQRFYWIGMRQDVQEWCRTCGTCCARNGPLRKTRARLQLYQSGAPMERVAVDIAGPFPITPQGNRFICVVMDYFTKWPEAYALPDHEATTVASALVDNFFTRFGVPQEMHSDQGREFESAVFSECCRLLGIKKTRTTPLRPQSDGMVERFNRTLLQEVAKYCASDQRDWDVHLPVLLMAYRSAEHEATAHTPARLMLGRELRLPVDLATGRPPQEEATPLATSYAQALQESMKSVHDHARRHLNTSGRSMKARYDDQAREAVFEAGDRVWLHNPRRKKGLSPKLQSPWEGPYDVIEALSDVTYRIRHGTKRSRVVHVDRLWKYREEGVFSWRGERGSAETDEASSIPVNPGGEEAVPEESDDHEPVGAEAAADEGEVPTQGGDSVSPDSSPPSPLMMPSVRPKRRRQQPRWMEDYEMDSD